MQTNITEKMILISRLTLSGHVSKSVAIYVFDGDLSSTSLIYVTSLEVFSICCPCGVGHNGAASVPVDSYSSLGLL